MAVERLRYRSIDSVSVNPVCWLARDALETQQLTGIVLPWSSDINLLVVMALVMVNETRSAASVNGANSLLGSFRGSPMKRVTCQSVRGDILVRSRVVRNRANSLAGRACLVETLPRRKRRTDGHTLNHLVRSSSSQ